MYPTHMKLIISRKASTKRKIANMDDEIKAI